MIDMNLMIEALSKNCGVFIVLGFAVSFVISLVVWSIFSAIRFFNRITRP